MERHAPRPRLHRPRRPRRSRLSRRPCAPPLLIVQIGLPAQRLHRGATEASSPASVGELADAPAATSGSIPLPRCSPRRRGAWARPRRPGTPGRPPPGRRRPGYSRRRRPRPPPRHPARRRNGGLSSQSSSWQPRLRATQAEGAATGGEDYSAARACRLSGVLVRPPCSWPPRRSTRSSPGSTPRRGPPQAPALGHTGRSAPPLRGHRWAGTPGRARDLELVGVVGVLEPTPRCVLLLWAIPSCIPRWPAVCPGGVVHPRGSSARSDFSTRFAHWDRAAGADGLQRAARRRRALHRVRRARRAGHLLRSRALPREAAPGRQTEEFPFVDTAELETVLERALAGSGAARGDPGPARPARPPSG